MQVVLLKKNGWRGMFSGQADAIFQAPVKGNGLYFFNAFNSVRIRASEFLSRDYYELTSSNYHTLLYYAKTDLSAVSE